jgi:prefoldin subunit 4
MDSNIKVTKEDQKFINEFSRLHQKGRIINEELRQLSEKQNNIKDALGYCDELFGENTKILLGEVFVELPEEEARERIEKVKNDSSASQKRLEERLTLNKKRLDELKIILYSKFGNSINLDE